MLGWGQGQDAEREARRGGPGARPLSAVVLPNHTLPIHPASAIADPDTIIDAQALVHALRPVLYLRPDIYFGGRQGAVNKWLGSCENGPVVKTHPS